MESTGMVTNLRLCFKSELFLGFFLFQIVFFCKKTHVFCPNYDVDVSENQGKFSNFSFSNKTNFQIFFILKAFLIFSLEFLLC